MGKNLKKLLVICGPTAIGKTNLALHLAGDFKGELISADSRQVYKYMKIGTGRGKEKILGYDLIMPSEEFSVSKYSKYAKEKINDIWKRNKLPIVVGGTGLYIKALVDGIGTIDIPKDENLRSSLSKKTPMQLLNLLGGLDPIKAASMNQSDAKNSRRLIRAIEIAKAQTPPKQEALNANVLWIGLNSPIELLEKKIQQKVDERIKNGFESEVEFLKKKDLFRFIPSNTIGYSDWPDIKKWKSRERQYAKRQMLWFSREKRINWFDVSKIGWQKNVEKLVKKWYPSLDAKEN